MGKTWLSVGMACLLVLLSAALVLARWWVLGPEIQGPPGASTWRVTLQIEGELTAPDASLTAVLAPNFRRQHISEETFSNSEGLVHRVRRSREELPRRVVWQRLADAGGLRPFEASYSFRCVMGTRRPNPAMQQRTRSLDAAPAAGRAVKPAPHIESDHEEIAAAARALVGPSFPNSSLGTSPWDQVRALYESVAALADATPTGRPDSALVCLRRGGGDALGKSRLLAALCRNRGIPTRLAHGLILAGGRPPELHHWCEAWVNDHWLPMDPTFHHFGTRDLPETYLVLHVGDDDLIRAQGATFRFQFTVRDVDYWEGVGGDTRPSAAKSFMRKASLYSLRPEEQQLVRFLLQLALAALVVSVFRTLIGVPTFGTFAPALLGLVCRDLRFLPWGLGIFVGILLVGWLLRHLLDRFHLLLVPRISALLTLIVVFLIAGVVLASHYGIAARSYVALFPLIILTHMVERFWTIESEDSTVASFKTLLGTVVVAVAVSVVLSPDAVAAWMLRYPETLGLILATQLVIGRYTGYRLSELFRFRDLAEEPAPAGRNS